VTDVSEILTVSIAWAMNKLHAKNWARCRSMSNKAATWMEHLVAGVGDGMRTDTTRVPVAEGRGGITAWPKERESYRHEKREEILYAELG
jgi:hypothetical protein